MRKDASSATARDSARRNSKRGLTMFRKISTASLSDVTTFAIRARRNCALEKNFQIIELNGAASEATSIYDARNSIFAAYRTLFRQWDLVFAIGAANRSRGCSPAPLRALWREWRQYSAAAVSYPCAS